MYCEITCPICEGVSPEGCPKCKGEGTIWFMHLYHVPNKETLEAIEEIESGEGESCDSVEELFEELEK